MVFDFVREISKGESFEIYLAAGNEEVWKDINENSDRGIEPPGYEPSIIDRVQPDIVICQEIWSAKTAAILQQARLRNIPVLMYDHGSLVFGSYYSLEGEEYLVGYRSNTLLCSHIACWGERGKECWLKYAAPGEKFEVTGALQYDALYFKKAGFNRSSVYDQLNIDKNKKIILLFSNMNHPSINREWNRREKSVLRSLEKFCLNNDNYRLVVKPHPSAMLSSSPPPRFAPGTILVANRFEDAWEKALRMDIGELCAFSHVAISSASSVLIMPLILNIPIIHIEVDRNVSKSFSQFGKEGFFNLEKGGGITALLKGIEKRFDEKRKNAYSRLAALLNYNNDGGAKDRLISFISIILEEKEKGGMFYAPEEVELLQSLKRHPDLPFPYQNLIIYYAKANDYQQAEKYFNEYLRRFKNPGLIFKRMMAYYFQSKRTPAEIKEILENIGYKNNLLTHHGILKLATVKRELGEGDDAALLLEELSQKEKKKELKAVILYELGLTQLLMKRSLEAAVNNFRIALKKTSPNQGLKHRIYFRLGEAYYKLNRPQQARSSFKRCLALCSNHRAAADYLEKLKTL
jgi:tetratricopeptide (TPR) repeat protein